MSRPTRNRRLFVAAYPDPEVAAAWHGLLRGLELAPHRRTARDDLHLTIQFVGDVAVADLDRVVESVERAAGGIGPFPLVSRSLGILPERGPAKVLAVFTDAPPGLLELRSRLVRRLATGSRVRPNDRFRPHVTLARFSPPTGNPVRGGGGRDLPAPSPDLPAFEVDRIRLMRSVLTHEGAEHRLVAEVVLAPPR